MSQRLEICNNSNRLSLQEFEGLRHTEAYVVMLRHRLTVKFPKHQNLTKNLRRSDEIRDAILEVLDAYCNKHYHVQSTPGENGVIIYFLSATDRDRVEDILMQMTIPSE